MSFILVGDPNTYITFFGLRKYGFLNEKIVSLIFRVFKSILIKNNIFIIQALLFLYRLQS